METQECSICHQVKPIDEFIKRKDRKSGRRNQCKSCLYERATANNRIRKKMISDGAIVFSETEQECRSCHKTKPLAEFYRGVKSKNGRINFCKECCKERDRVAHSKQKKHSPNEIDCDCVTKECYHCKKLKPLSDFGFYSLSKDGRRGICLECRSEQDKLRMNKIRNNGTVVEQICSRCHQTKPIDSFYINNHYSNGRKSVCKDCCNKQRKENYYSLNKEELDDFVLKYSLKTYGLSKESYESMLKEQKGVCAICGKPETAKHKRNQWTKRLSIDHDHSTGVVRGLLCAKCNALLGYADESIEVLSKAIEYLLTRKHNRSLNELPSSHCLFKFTGLHIPSQ